MFGNKTKLSGALLLALWILAPVILVFSVANGLVANELLGSFSFGLIVSSAITALSMIMAFASSSSMAKHARTVWIAAALVALIHAVVVASASHVDALGDSQTLLVYSMLILSFPTGLLVPFLMVFLSTYGVGSADHFTLALIWVFFLLAGYWQWFVFLPWVRRKFLATRSTA